MDAIFTIFDSAYFKYLKLFLCTLFYYNSDLCVYAFYVNPKKKTKYLIENIYKNYNLHVIPIKKKFRNREHKRVFIATRRFCFFYKLLKKHKDIYRSLFLDCDSLIQKPLINIFQLLDESDIILSYRPEKPDKKRKISAGLVGTRNNYNSTEFWNSYDKELNKLPVKWYMDQVALYYTFINSKNISFVNIPQEYQSVKFIDSATVIQIRGERKKRWNNKLNHFISKSSTEFIEFFENLYE